MKQLTSLLIFLFSFSVAASEFYQVSEAKHYQESHYEVTERNGVDFKIASHLYSNKQKNLVFMVHGYADNCAYLKPVTRFFLAKKFDVLCIELPGHGNSSGKRADIPQIESYQDIYQQIFPKLSELKYDSIIFFAHSTGNAGMIEHLLEGENHPFKKIIMAAPLIRSYLWNLSRFGQRIFGGILPSLPRRPSSVDENEFKTLKKLDPAPIKSVPTHWFGQLVNWNKKLASEPKSSQQRISVIFAGKDTVIDSKFNETFIRERFPHASIDIVSGSDHLMFWEEEQIQRWFFLYLTKILAI